MSQTASHRELKQTAYDGRTRTFRFSVTHDGIVMHVDIGEADGSTNLAASLDYHFTDAEFDQFQRLVGAA